MPSAFWVFSSERSAVTRFSHSRNMCWHQFVLTPGSTITDMMDAR